MALYKNELPILEYDTEVDAVIMAKNECDYVLPKKAVMLFMTKEIDDYVTKNNCELVTELECIPRIVPVYKTVRDGVEIAFCHVALGGPAAVQVLEKLIAGGVEEVIAAGCCGALIDGTAGEFFIPEAALRQEGTSYHYLPPSREVELSSAAVVAIEEALDKKGFEHRRCKVWTTDGFYRETKEMVLYRKEEGYSVVDMECASMAACAKFRNVVFGQLLFTADSLADVDAHDARNWGKDAFATAMELAMDSVVCIK